MEDITGYLRHLKIEYDKDRLIEEAGFLTLEPSESTQWHNADNPMNYDYWKKTHNWLTKEIDEFLPEVHRLDSIFKSDVIYFYNQLANTELPWHKDYTTSAAVNILLSDDLAPLTFRIGDSHYKCALINVAKPHMVKPHPTDRLLLKYGWKDKTFKQVEKEFKDKGLL